MRPLTAPSHSSVRQPSTRASPPRRRAHGLAGLRAIHRAELSELVPCSHLSLVLSATPQAGGTQFVSSLASERGKESSDPSHAVSSFASSAHAAIAAATSGVAGTCLVRATIPITHASGAYRGDVPLTSPKDTNKDGTIPPPLLGHAALLPLSQRAETLARFVPPPNGLSDGLALLIGSLKDGMAERWMERKLADLHRAVPSGSSSKRSVPRHPCSRRALFVSTIILRRVLPLFTCAGRGSSQSYI